MTASLHMQLLQSHPAVSRCAAVHSSSWRGSVKRARDRAVARPTNPSASASLDPGQQCAPPRQGPTLRERQRALARP